MAAPGAQSPAFSPDEVLVGFREGADPRVVVARALPGAQAPQRVVPTAHVANTYRTAHSFMSADGHTVFQGRRYVSVDDIPLEELFAAAEPTLPPHARALYRLHQVRLAGSMSVQEAVARLAADSDVQYAQPNHTHVLHALPNDPYLSTNGLTWSAGLWGQDEDLDQDGILDPGEDLDGNGIINAYPDLWGLERIDAVSAWSLTQGEGVVVAVVDSGVAYNHPDFFRDENANGILDPGERSNIWINPGEDRNGNGVVDAKDLDGKDNDRNGYVDDIRGYDFSDGDRDPLDDMSGHGTHVAGTIAAVASNGIGIAGIAPRARIMPLKFFPNATDTTAVLAIHYAVDNGAHVINNSWGPTYPTSSNPALEAAIDYAWGANVVTVFAAGNDPAIPIAHHAPANYPRVIAVTATTPGDVRSSFTSIGPEADIAAPGGGTAYELGTAPEDGYNILSLAAPGTVAAYYEVVPGYARLAGTSMAAPHVSGVVALVLARYPGLLPSEVMARLALTADDIGDPMLGAGRLNAAVATGLQLEIASPASEGWIHGPLSVTGSASYAGATWELTIAPSSDPEDRTHLVSSSELVVDGVLLSGWSTTGLGDGEYTLRLSLTAAGRVYAITTQVRVDNVNEPPVVVSPLSQVGVVGRANAIAVEATDADDPATPQGQLSYHAVSLPPGGQFDQATHAFTWTPTVPGDTHAAFTIADADHVAALDIDLTTVVLIPNVRSVGTTDVMATPDVSDDVVVWVQGGQIRARIGDAETVVDPAAVNVTSVAVAGHRVVWSAAQGLFFYDLDADPGWPTSGVTTLPPELLTAGGSVGHVDLSDHRVVYDDFNGMDRDVHQFDLATGVDSLVAGGPGDHTLPRVDGDRIVWWHSHIEYAEYDVYMLDLATGLETLVAGGSAYQSRPTIDDDRIVYLQPDGYGNTGAMLYDIPGSATTQLPVGNVGSAAIWGDTAAISLAAFHPTVALHDVVRGLAAAVAPSSEGSTFYHQTQPSISGNHVAWRVTEFTWTGSSWTSGATWIESAFYHLVPRLVAAVPDGAQVMLTGHGFGAGRLGQVLLDGVPIEVTSWRNTQIKALVPASSPGGALTVRTPGGTSAAILVSVRNAPALQYRIEGIALCLSWPVTFQSFVLEETQDLTPPVTWSPVAELATVVGETFVCCTPMSGPQRYFRLKHRPPAP